MRDLTKGYAHLISSLPETVPFSNNFSRTIHNKAVIYAPTFSPPPLGPVPFNSICDHTAAKSLAECLEDTTNDAVWTRNPRKFIDG
jgi:hypothetical protein